MKKIMFFIFFVFTCTIYSQKESSDLNLTSSNPVSLSISSGISSPSSAFSDKSFASSGSFFDFSAAYYFSKIGAGITFGSFSNPTEGNFSDFSNNKFSDPSLSVLNSNEDWKSTYFGVGPEFRTTLGNAFEATLQARFGSMSVKPIDISSAVSTNNADIPSSVPAIRFGTTEKTSFGYYAAGIKLGYKINKAFGLFFLVNHLSSLSKEIEVTQRDIKVPDLNSNGIIDQEDFISKDGTPIQFEYISTTSNVKPQLINYGIGLSYSFGKRTIKIGGTEKPYSRGLNQNPYFVDNGLQGDMVAMNSGSVVFTNPSKENKKEERKLVNVLPKNNSTFKESKNISNFTWKVIGKEIPNANYIIEITKISKLRQPERTFVQTTKQTSIKSADIFKEGQLSEGQYTWKVTETTTGISSNPSFFSMAPCEINFSISKDTIECLGYEGENRKFKICFDATYQSNTGNLTYANIGSGLTVFDQSYAPLTYTLVAPNPTLLTQIGATTTTVSYCFEVVVNNSVTSIGFGLQGDDLDPSPITCQPGVSANFDELPDCLCDDCEEIELSFDNFNIKPNGNAGNQFNFSGNINVNVPIYGIEFQIQSYSYTAKPGPCTTGVGSVEESGMFLVPATTINNSVVQLFNETISGSMSTNNNASKDIKYSSSSALTGAIPVNLTIGLPGPIPGLDPSCCVIDYEVCIKVIIFYEDGSCKSCDFNHCFQFNNQ